MGIVGVYGVIFNFWCEIVGLRRGIVLFVFSILFIVEVVWNFGVVCGEILKIYNVLERVI